MDIKEKRVWVAHTENDPISSFCHFVEQTFIPELDAYLGDIIYILNESVIFKRNGDDDFDEISFGIQSCDFVIALYTAKTNEDDLVAQLKRASFYGKKILTVFLPIPDYGKLSIPETNELRQVLSGLSHVYGYSSNIAKKMLDYAEQDFTPGKDKSDFEVFISHKSEDYPIAKQVYDSLTELKYKVFLSGISLPNLGSCDYMKEIDSAIDKSNHMIVVCSSYKNVMSGWVEAEWRNFINEKRSGRKKGNLITVVINSMKPEELPLSLRYYQVLKMNEITDLKQFLSIK